LEQGAAVGLSGLSAACTHGADALVAAFMRLPWQPSCASCAWARDHSASAPEEPRSPRGQATFEAYDRMTAHELFLRMGLSERLVNDFIKPTLLVGLFKPPEVP
jgi:hypothetical protein